MVASQSLIMSMRQRSHIFDAPGFQDLCQTQIPFHFGGNIKCLRAAGTERYPQLQRSSRILFDRQSAADKYHSAMSTQTPTYFSAPAGQTVHSRQSRLAVVNGQILRSTYTDYGLGGAGVKCVCDADAAGDEEVFPCTQFSPLLFLRASRWSDCA